MRFNKKSIGASTDGLPSRAKNPDGSTYIIKSYDTWQSMINRCYSKVYQKKNPSYLGCFVCSEWLSYSNFKAWFDLNYIDGYQLDKDLCGHDNKEYSPDKCRFVHPHINSILTDHKRKRGDYPQGVTRHRYGYQARINKMGVNHNIGSFKTAYEAGIAYSIEKGKYVRDVANKYMSEGNLDPVTYGYLMKWKMPPQSLGRDFETKEPLTGKKF